jgi:4-amino-4-deoxy-L-arabinose transferase-like glycosyltransferase
MKTIITTIRKNKNLLILLVLSMALRFVNLGYSNFQGDEIKAFFLPAADQTNSEFLLTQRKGPVQFILTAGIKELDPDYSNRFFVRFPFAFAGVLSVYYFYKFVEIHYGEKKALYAALFFCTNGFLVAFSRIVQYQAFVILFMVAALYYLSLAIRESKYRVLGVYLGLAAWALSILSHYDGVFIAPFMFFLLYRWFTLVEFSMKEKIKHFIIAGSFATILLLIFYVPFVMALSGKTMDYWAGRISGEVSTKISSSKYLFSVYQPIYVVHIYFLLAFFGLAHLGLRVLPKTLKFIGIRKFVNKIQSLLPFLADRVSTFFTSFNSNIISKDFALLLWFLIPLLFLEWYVYIPGTHIYTYLVPLFIVLGFGVSSLVGLVNLFFKRTLRRFLVPLGLLVVFTFIFLQSYYVFVDNTQEYPWVQEKFLFWTFPKPTPIFHLSMFGFPYYRNWEGIENFVNAHPQVSAYSTNERKSIARYHVPLPKDSDTAGFYVYIKNPQSFTNEVLSEKPAYWVENYPPDYTFTLNDREVSRVYIMEPGSLLDIKALGL